MPNDTDYMEDSPGQDAPANDNGGGDSKEKGDSPTFLINSEVCPDAKPGDTISVRVVAAHDKEFEVAYEDMGKDEKEEGEEAPPADDSTPGASGPPDAMMD